MSETLKVTQIDDHEVFGACVFLEAQTGDPEAVRDAYTTESPRWPPLHFAISAPAPEALEPWYLLGFHQMHVYGMRPSGAERAEAAGVTLRPGGPEDLETAIRIDRLIYDEQAASPSYSSYELDAAHHRANWAETLGDDDVGYFVAEHDGQPVGHATLYPDPQDGEALHLASTAVVPEARGGGVGLVLTTHALAYAAEQGYARLRTNWRATNLVASRYWPARGFEVTHIRLARRVPTSL
jgi:ribosomal protein S18 acetylase RimI-like enzyme